MERPVIKDKAILAYVEELEHKLSVYEKSPYVKSYLTVYHQIEDWNKQLTIVDGKGKIDLFADKDEKSFDRTFKYFQEILQMNKALKELRVLMSEEDKKEADNSLTVAETSILEKNVLKNSAKG